jgi:uncharacterized membrane protein
MGWLFKAFFKYPALTFQQGDFTFATSRSTMVGLVILAAIGVAALISYRAVRSEEPTRERLVLVGLRLALLAAIVFCLLRPSLILKAAVPQQNFLGVLIDDSRSMTIADRDGQPRTQFVEQQFGAPESALLKSLSEKFVLRYFRFSSTADRLNAAADLKYEGTATHLGQALERARDELSGLPLAGLVMVSDGADTSDASLDEPLASLKARSIPVFPVGVGREHFERDIQITRIETPRSTLKGTSLSVDVVVSQTGYGGTVVPLQVEDNGRIVSSQDVTLPADGESTTVRVSFTASEGGPRLFKFHIAPRENEQVTQNNQRDALVEVADRQEQVLYFEGEPRFEEKFIHRAMEEEKNLRVVVLQRLADEKYRRFDVDSPEELIGGFPKTREELFAYKGLILGSVEAAAFTPDQLRMLADFVSKRGGGLLMLGGRRAFAEGGWAGTPVAEVLPVELTEGARGKNTAEFFSNLLVKPTRAGLSYPVTQLGGNEKDSAARWDELPEISTVNPIERVKPGATILLTGTLNNRQEQVVLAHQRYGRGKALAFPVQDSWIWKMDARMAVEDMTHVTFWRRLVRWLVDGVPDPVMLTSLSDRVEPGEQVKLTAEVVDPAFVEVNDAHVVAQVVSPTGRSLEVPLEWTVAKDGEYKGAFVADEPGLYQVKGTATRGTQQLGTSAMHARASAGDNEYFDAPMRASLLTRIAEETGGHFFTSDTVSELPEAINYSGKGVTVVEERDLWDMPINLFVILGLIAAEWGYRRVRGLA